MKLHLPRSITARLALLFAAVVMGTFLLVGSYLYRSLALQLERRDDAELIGKITQTRHLLEEARSVRDIQRAPDTLLNAMFGHDGLLFMILAANGDVLVQNTAFSEPMLPVTIVSAERVPNFGDVRDWRTRTSLRRAIAARGAVGTERGEQVIIVVARDASERAALLRTYGHDLMLAALIGSLIATALGYMTVRNGLRPIREVARKANEITSRRLEARLRIEDAPAELYELASAFNAMLDRLEEGMKRLSGFAADLAHDLRTPVNALMIKAQVALSRSRSAEDYRTLLESNMDEFESLARLIERTLFLARAENEQLALRKEPMKVRETLEKLSDYFSGLAEETGVSIKVGGESTLLADPVLVERAVSNLMSNAIRHTPAGETVGTFTNEDAGAVIIAVENHGSGIAPEHMDRVFDRYFRGDEARTEAASSAGLGLAIVRAIMTLHGGTASAESTAEGLTRFVLRFPKQAPVLVDPPAARRTELPAASPARRFVGTPRE